MRALVPGNPSPSGQPYAPVPDALILFRWKQIGNPNANSVTKGPPLCMRNGLASISAASHSYGVSRGPARILERLPEALAGIVSGRAVPREQRAREDQLQSDQQEDRQPHQVSQGGCGDRRRG